jgi:hypothetical protein
VLLLEESRLQRELGAFSTALRIFTEDLSEFGPLPVIAIEHAETLFKQGSFALAGGVLQRAIDAIENVSEAWERDEYRLTDFFSGLRT